MLFPPTGRYVLHNRDKSNSTISFTRLDTGYILKQNTTEKDGSVSFLKVMAFPTRVSTSTAIHPRRYEFGKKTLNDGSMFFTVDNKIILALNNDIKVENIDHFQVLLYKNSTVTVSNGPVTFDQDVLYLFDGFVLYHFNGSKHSSLAGSGVLFSSAGTALYSTESSFNSRLKQMIASIPSLTLAPPYSPGVTGEGDTGPQPSPTKTRPASLSPFPQASLSVEVAADRSASVSNIILSTVKQMITPTPFLTLAPPYSPGVTGEGDTGPQQSPTKTSPLSLSPSPRASLSEEVVIDRSASVQHLSTISYPVSSHTAMSHSKSIDESGMFSVEATVSQKSHTFSASPSPRAPSVLLTIDVKEITSPDSETVSPETDVPLATDDNSVSVQPYESKTMSPSSHITDEISSPFSIWLVTIHVSRSKQNTRQKETGTRSSTRTGSRSRHASSQHSNSGSRDSTDEVHDTTTQSHSHSTKKGHSRKHSSHKHRRRH